MNKPCRQIGYFQITIFVEIFILFLCNWPTTVFAAPPVDIKSAIVRRLEFPTDFSFGKLYVSQNLGSRHVFIRGCDLKYSNGKLVGEARGVVTVAVPPNENVYLLASYDLVEKPEALLKLAPGTVDCLSFSSCGITSDLQKCIEPISHLTGLRRLELDVSELSDRSILPIKKLVNLESLSLRLAGVDGKCLKDLTALSKLRELVLTQNALCPESYTYLSKYHNLEHLAVNQCGVKDADLFEIAKLEKLRCIELSQSLATRTGLLHLRKLKNLRDLRLHSAKLSIADLQVLKGLRLTSLWLPLNSYSPSELATLHKTFPGATLLYKDRKVDDYTKTLYGPLH